MSYVLLTAVAVLCFSFNSIMTRTFQMTQQKKEYAIQLYQALFCMVASISYSIMAALGGAVFSSAMLLPALLFGAFFASALLFIAKCMDMGYMSLTAVVSNMSLVLPVLFSILVLMEPFHPLMLVGLALVLFTLVLSSLSERKGEGKGSIKRWLLFAVIAFISNGASAITQKVYITTYGDRDLMLFMALSYTVAALIFLVVYTKQLVADPVPLWEQVKLPQAVLLLAVLSGLGSFGGNALLGMLCDKVDGGILYPSVNGGLAVVSSIFSFLIFREKLTWRKMVAIFTGILAIVILNL